MGLLIRPFAAADADRVRELALESKARWGYERELVRRWAAGLSFPSGCGHVTVRGRTAPWMGREL